MAAEADRLNIDSVIQRLLEVRGSRPGTKNVQLTEAEIRGLCLKSREIFLSQPILLELEAPMKVVGDIHGQFYDLLRHFEYGGFPPEANYMFLGNYVDFGKQSLETICLLLAYKIKYPENFFLLRGNHECASVNRIYGFYDECKRRYNIRLWRTFTECFNCLPIAAIIDERIFCCHGGLSPDLMSMEQIRRIMRPTDVPDQGLMCDLLWANPNREILGWGLNDSDESDEFISFSFGPDILTKFLIKHDFDLVCRGHQVVEDGYEFFAKRQLVTIFSAVMFRGEYDNGGAVMSVDETLMCSFQIFKPGYSRQPPPWLVPPKDVPPKGEDEVLETTSPVSAEENQKHYEAYQQALGSGLSIALKYIKLLMLGPPRSGKTSLRRRLLGEIANLIKEAIQPSTGAVDAHNVVVKIAEEKLKTSTAVISESTWAAVGKQGAGSSDLDEELLLLYHFISEGNAGQDEPTDEPDPLTKSDESQENDTQSADNVTGKKSRFGAFGGLLKKLRRKKTKQSKEVVMVTEVESTKVSDHHTVKFDVEIESAYEAFNNALQSRTGQQQLKVLLEKTILLNMVDTGGQPAFIEMLPMLTIGPALYLIFLRLDQELKQRYQIKYVSEDNEEVPLGESSYTFQEVIFQVLSSIACFRSDTSSTTSSPEKQEITSHQSQAAMLVGTYKDKLEGSPEEVKYQIKKIDEALQKDLDEILHTQLFEADRDLLRYASDDQLMFDVDNMTGSADEVKTIRKRLEEVILQEFDELPIPASWLMFGLFLRRMDKHLVDLPQCEEIGRRLQVKDIREAIWFLHHCIGVLMYYPDVEELKDVVICDPQIVFDSVTEMILNTFKFGNISKAACNKFKQTGQFRFNDIQKLSKNLKSGILPLPQLVKLLEHLDIIAGISSPDSSTEESSAPLSATPQLALAVPSHDVNLVYFMPAVLPSAPENELNVSRSPVDPAPLLIRFMSGIVPVGVFCASIASLVGRKKLGWTLQEPKQSGTTSEHTLYKNRVTFRVNKYGGSYDVTLISRPKQYEVYITLVRSSTGQPCHDICKHVLETVCHTLDRVILKLKHKQFLVLSSSDSPTQSPYELGFQCPEHPQEDHMAVFRPSNEQLDPSLSLANKWLAFFENNTTLLCLKENMVVDLESVQASSNRDNLGEARSPQKGLQTSLHIEVKYGLWMRPSKVVLGDTSLTYYNVTTSLKTIVDWHTLGIMLEIEKTTMDAIRDEFAHYGMARQRDELLYVWLHNPKRQASWSKLCCALEEMEEGVLAEEIQCKFCH